MNTVTHALAPVILTRVLLRRGDWKRSRWFLLGLAGALPDIINPHLSLEARMASWSHGLPCWGAFTVIVLGISLWKRRSFPPLLAGLMSFAYLFHLFCDAIAGGINWLSPFGEFIWGNYWVDPFYWVPIDIVLLLILYFLFRLPVLRKRAGKG